MLTLLLLFPLLQIDLRAGSHHDGEETAVTLYFISLLKSVQSTPGIGSPQTPEKTLTHSHTNSKQMTVKLNGEGPGPLSWKTENILPSLKQNFRSHSDDLETSFSPFFLPFSEDSGARGPEKQRSPSLNRTDEATMRAWVCLWERGKRLSGGQLLNV